MVFTFKVNESQDKKSFKETNRTRNRSTVKNSKKSNYNEIPHFANSGVNISNGQKWTDHAESEEERILQIRYKSQVKEKSIKSRGGTKDINDMNSAKDFKNEIEVKEVNLMIDEKDIKKINRILNEISLYSNLLSTFELME